MTISIITIINGKGKVDFSEHAYLMKWYDREKEKYEISGGRYNLQGELLTYCIDDCRALAKSVLSFRSGIINQEIKRGRDTKHLPFQGLLYFIKFGYDDLQGAFRARLLY